MNEIRAWHFTGPTLRDGRPIPPVGEWLVHTGPLVPCESGLHGSERLLDALTYAPGDALHRVTLRGDVTPHGDPVDKLVARERRIDWTLDEEVTKRVLREFARWCALQVIHLWNAPEVVKEYLETGDERLRAAAGAAAGDAARAAWVAWDAAWAAAGDAAWAAAGDAAGDAAWAAARAAAGAAAGGAAWAAARGAARGAAWAAARGAQNAHLTALALTAAREQGLTEEAHDGE